MTTNCMFCWFVICFYLLLYIMLYTRQELSRMSFDDGVKVMQRYLKKVSDHQGEFRESEFRNLKWHEKDFFFSKLQFLKNGKGQKCYDIYTISEARDYVLYKLILIYVSDNNTIDFRKQAKDYDCEIEEKIKKQHEQIFYRLLNDWMSGLKKGKGQYLMVIKPLYEEKLKELQDLKRQRKIYPLTFIPRVNYMRSVFYHVYYHVRKYFDEMQIKAESCVISGITFYSDIYTYAHILTRHYYPNMNCGVGGSLNEDMPVIDVWNMPSSVLELIKLYAEKRSINKSTEYLLFIVDNKKYILWIRYGKIALLRNQEGMEVRTFYHCEQPRDLEKFEKKMVIKINEHLSIVA